MVCVLMVFFTLSLAPLLWFAAPACFQDPPPRPRHYYVTVVNPLPPAQTPAKNR